MGWSWSATGGGDTFQVSVGFNLYRVADGHSSSWVQYGVGGSGSGVQLLGCLAPGEYRYSSGYSCEYYADYVDEYGQQHYHQPLATGGSSPGGSFTVGPNDSNITLQATLLDPPETNGNVTITYGFGPNSFLPRITVDNGLVLSPTALSGKQVVNLLPGRHLIFGGSACGGSASTFIDVPSTVKPEYQVRAQNITSGGAAETHGTGTPMTATIPLGARFTLSLQHVGPSPTSIMSNFALGPAALTNAQVDPVLYPSSALLQFNAAASDDTKTFQAMHLGTQNVVITPDDGAIPRATVTVKVVKPAALGTTHQTVSDGTASFNLDTKIVEWADKRGIPPQLIKGIIDRESASLFTPREWRYEPLTTDWDNFAPPCPALGLGSSVCHNERARERYVPYRMEYDASHPRGVLLIDSQDVHPRSFFFSDFMNKVRFADSQQLVSVYEIVSENESWQNWIKILGNQKKKALLGASQIQSTLSWPANTTLASSYGLMQVLFEESFENYGYAGIQGQRRPYYLFDVPANVAAGGGSVPVGSGHYVFKYRWENGFNDKQEFAPAYDTPAALDDDYQNGLMGYNGDFCQTITAQKQCYGPDTMNRIKKYPPIAATSIFP